MHNNGTTPQIILPDRRLLPDLTPPGGIAIGITPHGVEVKAFIGDQALTFPLDFTQATQLGVNLISAAGIGAHAAAAASAAAKPTRPAIIVD
jgi:hypothetical protein